jgi:hypothetical protein
LTVEKLVDDFKSQSTFQALQTFFKSTIFQEQTSSPQITSFYQIILKPPNNKQQKTVWPRASLLVESRFTKRYVLLPADIITLDFYFAASSHSR